MKLATDAHGHTRIGLIRLPNAGQVLARPILDSRSNSRGCSNGALRQKINRLEKSAIAYKRFPMLLARIQSGNFDLRGCLKLYGRVIQNHKFLSGRKIKKFQIKNQPKFLFTLDPKNFVKISYWIYFIFLPAHIRFHLPPAWLFFKKRVHWHPFCS